MLIPQGPSYSWKKASILIALSLLFSFTLFAFFRSIGDQPVVAIVQEPQTYELQTTCLAELLELSTDHPLSFSHFPLKEASQRLSQYPFIASANVQKIRPNILYIRYALREPIAIVGNFSNTAIDATGKLFPIAPFYKPLKLPTVYLEENTLDKMLYILQYAVEMIDFTSANDNSLGKREIVVHMQDGAFLRLSTHRYREELFNYTLLAKKMEVRGKMIDFRIPNVAYIDE